MTCRQCGQHFCYRCGVKLERSNPYQHFSIPGLACYYKLFDFQDERAQEREEDDDLRAVWLGADDG